MRQDHWLVTPDHGPRPAGPPDQCFYCQQPLGAEHGAECVLRQKTVRLTLHIPVVVAVPEYWETDDIEFYYGQSSHCLSSFVGKLARWEERHKNRCLCGTLRVTMDGEAAATDHDDFPVLAEDGPFEDRVEPA